MEEIQKLLDTCQNLLDSGIVIIDELLVRLNKAEKQVEEYALLLFQPQGEAHHNANECPYCKENLNGKS